MDPSKASLDLLFDFMLTRMTSSWRAGLIFLFAVTIFTAITAIVGNALVIHALRGNCSLHPPTKALMGCLALSDLAVGLIAQPIFATVILAAAEDLPRIRTAIRENFLLFAIPIYLFLFVSLWAMTTIAMDRFLALHLRQTYRVVVTLRRLIPILASYWAIGVLISSTWQWEGRVVWTSSVISWGFCITVSTFAFIKGYIKLRQHWMQVQSQDENNSNSSNLNLARYKKSLDNMVCVFSLMMVCYIPQGCITATFPLLRFQESVKFTIFVTSTIMNINSSLNPLVYCWKIRAVRTGVLQSLRGIFHR